MNYSVVFEPMFHENRDYTDRGFNVTLANQVYVSVKFGFGSYSDGGNTTAEVAVIDKDNNWYVFSNGKLIPNPDGSEANSHITPDQLADIMYLAKQL